MHHADLWVLKELTNLGFAPYAEVLPRIVANCERIRTIELSFREAIGNRLTKRQAVAYGLLARTFQLSISCLVNQLQQNHSGWHCSYRSLMETFFVADWVLQDLQRLEAFFESHAPAIGRIKNDCCHRHPEFTDKYDSASQVTHVGTVAFHLSRGCWATSPDELPFAATEMHIGGSVLADNLVQFEELQALTISRVQSLTECRDALNVGEVLWEKGVTKSQFGCLAYQPRGFPAEEEPPCHAIQKETRAS